MDTPPVQHDCRLAGNTMSLEAEFHRAVLNGYRRTGQEVGYWGNYFLRSVRNRGALEAAKRVLRPLMGSSIQKGLQALIDAGRPDLSTEALVLEDRFKPLFSKAELSEARRRLKALPKHARRRRVPLTDIFPDTLPRDPKYHVRGARRVLVNTYERDPRARKACLKVHGHACKACGVNSGKRYGEIGKGFIHVHHIKPLDILRRGYLLNPRRDLIPVCPNCHAMLHSSNPPLAVAELKQYVREVSG
jgi:5-methylcytosine-specific restriction protein A